VRAIHLGACVVAAQLLAGCASIRLPLCSTIAARSFPEGAETGPVNAFIQAAAERRRIRIEVLSPITARFRGSRGDVRWLEANYKHLVCAFEPGQVSNARSTYMSCLAHAEEWVAATQSKSPENLMLQQYLYVENCMTPIPLAAATSEGFGV
jgi:hypothetical protein